MITSNNESISDILKSINDGKTQLPDFQRGWVWEDERIRALIASISNGYPIGAAMFLQTGGKDIQFKYRLFEGVDKSKGSVEPDRLVLDGQQRNTSIYRAMYSKKPVETVDSKKKPIKRFYYLNIPLCLDTLTDRIDAVESVPEDKIVYKNIGREIKLDLSTREKEFEEHRFPLNIVFDSQEMMRWQRQYTRFHNSEEVDENWDKFYDNVLVLMATYQIPVIQVGNDVPKEAVCQVFENVNQGGVSLTVFELVTATFAVDNFELRKDWEDLWKELQRYRQLYYKKYRSFTGTDFLTALTLLASYVKFNSAKDDRPKAVSCKKKDVLRLTYTDYQTYRNKMLSGLIEAVKFLEEQRVFTAIDMPYTSQLIPLSVAFALDKNLWYNASNRRKLEQWYWCGVFGELYGGANETRYVTDITGLIEWTRDDDAAPDTVRRSNFHASRLKQLYTRNSAAYKGIIALIMKAHALDFIKGSQMDFASYVGETTDIHHIFPQHFCESQHIDRALWNSVINKTPLYARTNRIIGGNAPSKYLSSIERNHGVDREKLNEYISSHMIDVDAIRSDDFDAYFTKRTAALLELVEQATGKAVAGWDEQVVEELSSYDLAEMNDMEWDME